MTVKIVTDSTSDFPKDTAQSLGVTVVAQNVHFGTETFKDNVTITPDDFYSMLAESTELPKTSQASPGDFKEVYDELGADADGIVSVHVSAKISGTCNSALQAAELTSASCPIEVVDSAQASMGLGLVVAAAAEAANRGAGHDEVAAVARDAVGRAQCFCLFETLEYLEKGGRIGKAQAMIGSVLKIKPMIIVRDGEVTPLSKARTFQKALVKMKQTARDFGPLESLAIMHSTTPEAAAAVADDLKDLLPEGNEPFVARFGSALGVHTGPGAIGIALLQAGT
jgi:DegV family protein with EDD domain